MADNGENKAKTFTGCDMRLVLRRARTATLSTLSADDGGPYGSLVNLATDVEGAPLILVSRLALHTQNLLADCRASILVGEAPPSGDPLVGQRVTVMGRFEQSNDADLRRRYLARQPHAGFYAGFADFSLWRMIPSWVHGVAGFGRIETLAAQHVFPSLPDLKAIETSAIDHMNEDHASSLTRIAQRLLGRSEADWRMTAVDGDGMDLAAGEASLWVPFPAMVRDGEELRASLSALANS